MVEIAMKLSDAQVGKYFVLNVDWTDQVLGKSIHNLEIVDGSLLEKLSDCEVAIGHGVKHILSAKQLDAINVVSESDFYRLKFGDM